MSTPNVTATQKTSFFTGRKMWFWIAVALGLITTLLLALLLQGLTSTTTYYVVNKDVAARTLVTAEDLTPVVTSTGGQPPTALGLAEVNEGDVYSLHALKAGDILTASNAGSLAPLTDGLPTNFVVASFVASPNLSAGGNIKRGDYIDMFYIDDSQGNAVKLFLQRVLVIDATSDLENASAPTEGSGDGTSTDPNSVTSQYRVGVPVLYTVGVTQEDAAKIALASQFTIYLTLSSADSVENGVDPKSLQLFLSDLFGQDAGNAGDGTDNTFTKAKKETGGSGTTSGTTDPPQDTEEVTPEETDAPTDGATEGPDTGNLDDLTNGN